MARENVYKKGVRVIQKAKKSWQGYPVVIAKSMAGDDSACQCRGHCHCRMECPCDPYPG